MQRPGSGWRWMGTLVASLALVGMGGNAGSDGGGRKTGQDESRMSPMGRLAARARAAVEAAADAGTAGTLSLSRVITGPPRDCLNAADCDGGFEGEGPAGGQAEVSIAVDATGQHVVIGFNDTRGFSLNPLSVSGYMYSDDGGQTFVDGGQLPSPGAELIGTTKLPQVFGDPEVKYLGGCTFIYSSILVSKFSATRTVQTMGVHRSTDCGHTWTGPFEVTPATNPHGQVNTSGTPRDAADKEFMDVDPDTGRVIMSWSNFTPFAPGGVEIASTYSDDMQATPPTWSTPRAIVSATSADGQASIPRFAGLGSANAYVAWRRYPFPGTFFGFGNSVAVARSTDNGASWGTPTETSPEFFTMDQVLGNDRVNTSPSLAVDNSGGPYQGSLYLVYANNDAGDGADVVFQKSTDEGVTFSSPLVLNSRPGADRAQWFPWVTVDSTTGRIHVFYYDQGSADSGDLSQVSHTYSDDGGLSWKQPLPLTERPFHAGWGNDTGQPNLGDYNQAVAQGGELFVAFAVAGRPPLGFVDGQPSTSMTVPDVVFRRIAEATHKFKATTLDVVGVTFTDSGGNGYIDPNETITLTTALRNYVTNPLNAEKVRGATVTLTTATPGVTVVQGFSPLPNLDPGQAGTTKTPFLLRTSPSFVVGTFIELNLSVRSAEHGEIVLLHTLFTGTPSATTVFSENFDGVAPGTVPAGWALSHGGGANTVPWTTVSTFCGGGSNAAFHANANDGPAGPPPGSPRRWERLFSPAFTVPADAEYVTVDFDVCYDTEEDPNFNVLAYDGFFLRVTDLTSGRTLRSVLAEAFEDEFTTGSLLHYPRHFPRSSNPAYFEDMSAWAGFSDGWKHVRMRLPGMQGSTAQLRFEYTQDGGGTCADLRPAHTCGVAVDNVVVRSVKSVAP